MLPTLFGIAHAGELCDAAVEAGWRNVEGSLVEPPTKLDYHVDMPALDLFGRLVDSLEAKGIRVVVVVVPERTHTLLEVRPEETARREWLEDERAFQSTLAFLRDHGALAPDLSVLAKRMRQDGLPFYRPDDTHWAADGGAAAAQLVANALLAERDWPWAGSKDQDLVSVKLQKTQKPGPYAQQVEALCGALDQPPFQNPLFRVRAPNPGSETLLAELPPPPVVVIGSSFARPGTGFPQALAAAVDADVLTVAVVGGRVVTPMRAWLASANLGREAPAVLVWVLPASHLFGPDTMPGASLHQGTGFRLVLPMLDGGCDERSEVRALALASDGQLLSEGDAGFPAAGNYLSLDGGNVAYTAFDLEIRYGDGTVEQIPIAPDPRLDDNRSVRFEFLQDSRGEVSAIKLFPKGDLGAVRARVCRYENAVTSG